MEHNLNTKFGNSPLNYPHWIKINRNLLRVVTTKGNEIQEGDVVYDKVIDGYGNILDINIKDRKVVSVKETRPAMGIHMVSEPISQLLEVEEIKQINENGA